MVKKEVILLPIINKLLAGKILTENEFKQAVAHKDEFADLIFRMPNMDKLISDAFENNQSDIYKIIHQRRGFFNTSDKRGVRKIFHDKYLAMNKKIYSSTVLFINLFSNTKQVIEKENRHTSVIQTSIVPKNNDTSPQFSETYQVSNSFWMFYEYVRDKTKFFFSEKAVYLFSSPCKEIYLSCDDEKSHSLLKRPLDKYEHLKIYIIGHGNKGIKVFASNIENQEYRFCLHYSDLANILDNLFQTLYPGSKAKNVEICLITCYAAHGKNEVHAADSVAAKLQQELQTRGHQVVIKASPGGVQLLLGVTFYAGKSIFVPISQNEFKAENIHSNFAFKINKCVKEIYSSSYVDEDIKTQLRPIIDRIEESSFNLSLTDKQEIITKLQNIQTALQKGPKKTSLSTLFGSVPRFFYRRELVDLLKNFQSEVEVNVERPASVGSDPFLPRGY